MARTSSSGAPDLGDDHPHEAVCSPVGSYGSRPSIDSAFSELSLSRSLDLHAHTLDLSQWHAAPAGPQLLSLSPSASSLVREPLPEHHHTHLKKTLKKLKPGQPLPGRKVRHLGKGGVGEVHLVELDMPDGAQLQVAHKAIICRKYNAQRHAREMAAMEMAVGCPFVLRCYGGSQPGKAPYSVYTEFAPLGSLHDLIQHRRRAGGGPGGGRAPYFCEEEVRWLGARVLVALAHIHEQGLVHRDVSPHNIYRSASGHPLLADFDAAELLDEDGEVAVTGGAGLVGRLAVAAPEVRAAAYGGGGVYGAKSDMWSLGMVLLEMVSDQEVADGPKLEGCGPELRALLLEGLLVPQSRRLDSAAAQRHPFFASIRWDTLEFEEAPPGLKAEGI
ncbi:hypothetical protein CHLRE_12g535100v5 [Chlamydomonas reinhardtii]|uniref:Protein kinase domain-containing protein n=1 Tax=Chlamydomonas reinhardtii TaxID=3055 RepID=A0A2K3D542_CHLRE|nr:uncharacterized protein CHLRE_12g535100v5 [Chlamydomonas reinhardtii]PNW75645.1 hypothetical protein CHLRE_12g535100v5 [Chlamydomonas reinhardtii]